MPEDDTIPDEEHFIDIEDAPGYQTAFSQLAFAGKKEHDPVGQMVNNPKIHLAQSLHKLSTACPGRVSDLTYEISHCTEKENPFHNESHGHQVILLIIKAVCARIRSLKMVSLI